MVCNQFNTIVAHTASNIKHRLYNITKTKHFITMSIFMLASCFSFAALPPNRVHNVTQVEAEEKILDEFKNQDVNIFKKEEFLPSLILNGGAESSKWTFFL